MPQYEIAVSEHVNSIGWIRINADHIETDTGTLLVFDRVAGEIRVPLAISPSNWYFVLVTDDQGNEYADIVEWHDKGY